MQITYYSWIAPHVPRVIDVPETEIVEWKLPTFAQHRAPESLKPGEWPKPPRELEFIRTCPEIVYRAGPVWLMRARIELDPQFLAWRYYAIEDFARLWKQDCHPAYSNWTRQDFANFAKEWPADPVDQDEYIADLREGTWQFCGMTGPWTLSRIVKALQAPRYAKFYLSDYEAAGLLWAEGISLPAGLDPRWCEPFQNCWTGHAQIAAIARLESVPKAPEGRRSRARG